MLAGAQAGAHEGAQLEEGAEPSVELLDEAGLQGEQPLHPVVGAAVLPPDDC